MVHPNYGQTLLKHVWVPSMVLISYYFWQKSLMPLLNRKAALCTGKLGPHFLSQVRVRKKPIFTAAAKPHLSGKNEAIFLIMKLGEKLVASIIA